MARRWVVRGKNDREEAVWVIELPNGEDGYCLWPEPGESADDYPAHRFDSLTTAAHAREFVGELYGNKSARLFEVDKSGVETAIPSFEELLSTAQAHREKCLDACGCSVCGLLRRTAGTPRRGDGKRG